MRKAHWILLLLAALAADAFAAPARRATLPSRPAASSGAARIAPAEPASPSVWRPALSVLPFTDRTRGEWLLWTGRDVGEGLARLVRDSLASTQRWHLPDTARVSRAFAVRSRQALLSDANALALGASLGSELTLSGVVTTFGVVESAPDVKYSRWGVGSGRRRTTATVVLELRLLDCGTGAVVRTSTLKREELSQSTASAGEDRVDPDAFGETPLGRATRQVIAAAVQLVEEELTARANVRVMRIVAGRVVLDAGRARGLALGQQLAVMRPELVTLDPDEGSFVPQSERVAAELVVTGFVDAAGRQAICRVRRGSAQPGDIVRLRASGENPGR